MLEKTYRPGDIELRLYQAWEESGAFRCDAAGEGAPFCVVIPPPNVTGSLHMGHALNTTLQDVLVRFERMRGRDVLWQPGTDHAGIATQMLVERQLADEGTDRRTLGREAFIERVWKWKEESGDQISMQLRRLGASCDWSRERFTMDDGLSAAVSKVFVGLYREGLIYRDKRLVNWDPKLRTAISDLEVVQREMNGKLWHFRYPVEGEAGQYIVVATTRPETMLGDTAVAVHPDDERYTALVGKQVRLPIVNRLIPIVADEHADPEQGSGAVKITPAHDFNDFEVGRRHDLPMINVMEPGGTIIGIEDTRHEAEEAGIPPEYHGKDRVEARKMVVKHFEDAGLLEKAEEHVHVVPHGDRSGVAVEPFLTDQWFVNAEKLAGPAIQAVESGDTNFVPDNWKKTYFEWMRNIQPWCISRQLWWGHRIPAWFGPDGEAFVAHGEAEVKLLAQEHYGKGITVVSNQAECLAQLTPGAIPDPGEAHDFSDMETIPIYRDEDVLDTWFSSALWAFSTLGWPEQTRELEKYYPTSILVTGFDIIFFWVARMMMFGLHFMGRVPFGEVYIHALVRDEKGQKMSKSRGNVIDPLALMDEYGTDALRFTLTSMEAQGRDIKLSKARVEGYRNFATKIWNAARFCEMNDCFKADPFNPADAKEPINRWIIGKAEKARESVTQALESRRFNDAADAAYHFVWRVFCDWFVELSKPVLTGNDETARAETQATAAWSLGMALKLLHPMMPFVTEELWSRTGGEGFLMLSAWPEAMDGSTAESLENDVKKIDWFVEMMNSVRSARSELKIPANVKIKAGIRNADKELSSWEGEEWIKDESYRKMMDSLTGLYDVESKTRKQLEFMAPIIVGDAVVYLKLTDAVLDRIIDKDDVKKWIKYQMEKTKKEYESSEKKLSNEKFISRARPDVVEEQKLKHHILKKELNVHIEFEKTLDEISDNLGKLLDSKNQGAPK